MVDGMVVGPGELPPAAARHRQRPPDVASRFQSGFQLALELASSQNGEHTISVQGLEHEDLSTVLDSRDVWFKQRITPPRSVRSNRLADERRNTSSRNYCTTLNPPSGLPPYAPGDHIDWVLRVGDRQNDQVNLEGIVSVQLLFEWSAGK